MSKHPFADVAHAAINGKRIQWRIAPQHRIPGDPSWTDAKDCDVRLLLNGGTSAAICEWRTRPEPVTVRSRRYWWRNCFDRPEVAIANSLDDVERVEQSKRFFGWLEDWQTHEAPEAAA